MGSDMLTASRYRIYADNALVDSAGFQLKSDDSLVVIWASNGATIRLEADQNPGHPGSSRPRATVEACGRNISGTFSIGQVNKAPQDDEDIDVEIDCMQIRDSYDPNDKLNSPEGIGLANVVLPEMSIDFMIRFQNTGTDTAYKVVVVDSLSNDFDLSTLELGTSSHPYVVSLSGQGIPVLRFTFDNINLVDSITDEMSSHGFIKYKITPKAGTPLGTRINNQADIFFDYNFPIRTNTAFVTLGDYSSIGINKVQKANDFILVIPNPFNDKLRIENGDFRMGALKVYNLLGVVVYETMLANENPELNLDFLPPGSYLLEVLTKDFVATKKIVKL
jgi:uncharacterized repeat protein (TIGR01451 family)